MRVDTAREEYEDVAWCYRRAQEHHSNGTVRTPIERCYGCTLNDQRANATSIRLDLAVAQQYADRDGGPHMIAAWLLR